jgi:uncharacterized membrane protein YfcA
MRWFPLAVTLVAFLYASVGHGGASGYYATGVLLGLSPQGLKAQVLILNLFVAGLSAFSFTRKGYFRFRLLAPLVAASMPCAFLGAKLVMPVETANKTLGACLFLAALRLIFHDWLQKKAEESKPQPPRPWVLAAVGALLGLVAGITGVGGGIYLSPVLLLTGWASAGETAVSSAWFIVLNSASALASLSRSLNDFQLQWLWIACGCAGGALGGWVGANRLPLRWFRRMLGLVLLIAAVKLL